jgi:hypothetical protein
LPKKDRNIQLRAIYERLRKAGFTSKEATRLRGASPSKIDELISLVKSTERDSRIDAQAPAPVQEIKPVPVQGGRGQALVYNVEDMMSALPQRVPGESRAERNARLRQADALLKAAGFSSKERSRLRNAKPDTIRAALQTGELPKQRHGIEFDPNPDRRFLNRYNVVVVVHFYNRETGEYEDSFVTLTSNFKPTKGDIKLAVADIVSRNGEMYKDKVFAGYDVENAFEQDKAPKREPRKIEKAGYGTKYAKGSSSNP